MCKIQTSSWIQVQSDDKDTIPRERLHDVANKLKDIKWDPHLESSRQDPKISEIQNAPAFEERSIEWSLRMEEKARTPAWIFTHFLGIDTTESREQCFFASCEIFEREN